MTQLWLLAPIEPRDPEAWRDSSHAGVVAVIAGSEAEARRKVHGTFSLSADGPWLDGSLSFCLPTREAASGQPDIYFAAKARLKGPKRAVPEDAIAIPGDDVPTGPGSFTARPRLDEMDRSAYVATALDPETGLRADIEPRQFLEDAADATILSYPKSGKTWIAYLVTHYVARYLGFSELFEELTGGGGLRTFAPESRRGYLGSVAARRTPERWAPLVRFMHQDSLGYPYFAPKTLGAPGTARHVLLVRDPRDILVSHFHHVIIKNRGVFDAHREKPQLSPDTEIGEFIRSEHFGIRHVLAYFAGWGRWADANHVPVRHYEDFLSDPEAALSGLLADLGVSEIVPTLVRDAVEAASFDRLQSAERNAQRERGKDDDPSSRRMRRGQAGSHRDEVSAEDSAFMTRVMERASLPLLERYLVS